MFRDVSDFQEYHGNVSALQLPAGTYYLSPWMRIGENRITPTFVFDVRAGETTYAGELFMTSACTLETYFVLRDQYDRDISVARKKNPAIDTRPMVKRLLRLGPTLDN
jgi:hypothetical protein